jgi:HD domain
MRLLKRFRPRLIGSVMTGHVRQGSDIDLHVFSDNISAITMELDEILVPYDVERKRVRKDGTERVFTHIHVKECFPIELTVYSSDSAHIAFKSSITGKTIERASIAELEQLLAREYPELVIESALEQIDQQPDPFQVYQALLLPLENVKQHPLYHPEGDALYHSLQVFDLARNEHPYDEEFLLAALLHDVGKGIDPHDHVRAGLEALDGFISERISWLIENHMEAHRLREGTLGVRARRRLKANPNYDELLLLCECDSKGRVPGAAAPELDEAIEYIRELQYLFS